MATEATTNVQKAETSTVATAPEQTRTGPVYAPPVDIFENDHSITLLADMPGVKASDLEIDLRENVLTLTGRVTTPATAKESTVLREYRPGTFFRQFTLSEAIDQPKIDAQLSDGVLRLELPKVEKARPRQITVRAA
ncbi:MAG TPA: Hsp20/alpha crystallin family protein [Polyangia bacterium]|nr:Hsp20/alpha crystallin family protein [Polyangia bacterium]